MIAFDSNDQLVADLQDRYIDALVIQRPMQMGYESVKALGRKLQGQPVRKPGGSVGCAGDESGYGEAGCD